MYLIIGLGNPEEEYSKTRHNMGFDTINNIAEKYNINVSRRQFDGLYGKGIIEGESVVLIKPQTYMNLSGKSVKQFVDFYKVDIENIIVIYDDMDIDIGNVKLRKKGGAGGHNGMKSVIQEIASDNFSRVRVGIGKPKYKTDVINYVIGPIPEEEYIELSKSTSNAAQAVIEIIKSGIDNAMNKFN